MLIGFSAENFRSFKKECTFSLLASNYYKENEDTLLEANIPGLSGARVLPVTAIYGSNASGKSTLLAAMREMRAAVLALRGPGGNPMASHQPFMLDDSSRFQPTTFSIEFCTKRADDDDSGSKPARYSYTFSYTQKGIVSEDLHAYFSKMPRHLFSRQVDEEGNVAIDGSSTFPIPNEVKNLIGDHMLVLSFFAQADKSKTGKEARVVTDWFKNELTFVDRSPGKEPLQMFSGEILDGTQGTDYQRNLIRKIMSRADVGLTSVEIERMQFSEDDIPDQARHLLSSEMLKQIADRPFKRVAFNHRGSSESLEVPFESDGTMQLFVLSGFVAQALERGSVLLVDELDASLHPELANEIIALFLDKGTNPNGAQLVFTAHNPCLMNGDSMRRDEFWITEKSEVGESTLYPISDFKARKGESIQSAYMQGKYSGIPVIPKCFGMCDGRHPEAGASHVSQE